jgi:hypothetical protein
VPRRRLCHRPAKLSCLPRKHEFLRQTNVGIHASSEGDRLHGPHTSCDAPRHPISALRKAAELVPLYSTTLGPCAGDSPRTSRWHDGAHFSPHQSLARQTIRSAKPLLPPLQSWLYPLPTSAPLQLSLVSDQQPSSPGPLVR